MIAHSGARARLEATLDTLGTSYYASTAAELMDVLMRHAVGAVIVEPCDASGLDSDMVIRCIRRDYPSLPVLAYCELTADHMKRIPELVRAGADDVVLRGIDDMAASLRRIILRSASERAVAEALGELRRLFPKAAESVITYCLTQADRPLTVDKMARDLGVHRKTLCNRAVAVGLPTPSTLISWCRLVHAGRLLNDVGRSVERTALILGFGSGTALRNMLRRYTGLRPSELRRRGGHRAILSVLQEQLVVHGEHGVC